MATATRSPYSMPLTRRRSTKGGQRTSLPQVRSGQRFSVGIHLNEDKILRGEGVGGGLCMI